jgi:lipopolysaccharide transport system permease protein
LYATPIAYSSNLIPENWRALLGLNPMAGVVNGFRWALLGQPLEVTSFFTLSILTMLIFFFSGLFYFQRMEQTFADFV